MVACMIAVCCVYPKLEKSVTVQYNNMTRLYCCVVTVLRLYRSTHPRKRTLDFRTELTPTLVMIMTVTAARCGGAGHGGETVL